MLAFAFLVTLALFATIPSHWGTRLDLEGFSLLQVQDIVYGLLRRKGLLYLLLAWSKCRVATYH